jgi:hypothetical protein
MYLTCHPSDIPTNPTNRAIRVSSASVGTTIYDLRDAEARYPIMSNTGPKRASGEHRYSGSGSLAIGTLATIRRGDCNLDAFKHLKSAVCRRSGIFTWGKL